MKQGSEIILISLVRPSSPIEYRADGKQWLRAHAKLNNSETITVEGRLPTCCPSFSIQVDLEKKCKITKVHGVTRIRGNRVTSDDVKYMLEELTVAPEDVPQFFEGLPMDVSVFKLKPVFKTYQVDSNCDFFRLEHEMLLRRIYCGDTKYSSKWEKRFSGMDTPTMQNVLNIIDYKPWMLCFDKIARSVGFKALPVKRLFIYSYPQDVDIRAALLLYEYIQELRELGDTLFNNIVESYTQNRQRAYYEYGLNPAALENGVSILYVNAGFIVYGKVEVMERDLATAKGICHRLSSLSNGNPKERAFQIPCKPVGTLSTIQEAFVRHVVTNQLTLLQGPPGTGKTECLVALMARFSAPLVVTFVGQMVDALQKRFGCRVETAHTIHSILFNQGDWLDPFDLIVIDEFSNVDERLFSNLLAAVPRACRLVCAGDLAQIFPIKPGCPFYDLADIYPQHSFELIENKRVDPDSAALAQASILLRDNRIAELPFTKDGALRFIDRNGTEGIEETIMEFGKEVMDFQVVTLRNIDRRLLNDHIQKILIKNYILKPPKTPVELFGGKEKLLLYPGQKIQFLKNTPAYQSYSPVRNGELAKVLKVKRIGPSIEVVCTNGKRVLIGPSHVSKKHVIPGYATTCNKAQGSEWKYILFYIYENPNRFFTREYPYVAVSRAKKRCVIIGKPQEFAFLCEKKARPRASILHYLLTEKDFKSPFERIHDSSTVRMQNYDRYTMLSPDVPAVPRMTIKKEK